ncbi:aminotransferase class V-fold PLP-dependent enzyme [Oribacterium sp. WCC10]|uniref:aminotransferase class V-fold PLP-dependent enzyme n=1 Tax=Oribacterium sp. WCC10 TaxID=1855343 RepID=UPI0008F24EE1|nr:cysteine desulfurase [Oribacterium sp. WCC10]SFG42302.1 cysteine desulfurase / selenocysteine lyase [Oribacterium sp. WCC10]
MFEIKKNKLQAEDARILKDFPILDGSFVYLDNGATTQKPKCVIDAVDNYYKTMNANPMRGLYKLSIAATDAYEEARETVRSFINAGSEKEIIFTRNATESLNLIAYSYGRTFINEGDEVVITIMEHHSNMIPWQQVCKEKGAKLTYILPDQDGKITEEKFRSYMNPNVKLVSMTHISNVLGVRNDVKKFAKIAHETGAVFVCDGAQSIPHTKVDVQDLDVDFLAFSGHKIYAPMGIGVLYGKKALLEKMPPFLFGGEMIEYVTTEGATWNELPHKFEAGTVNDGGAIGLSAALKYVNSIGFERIEEREVHLTRLLVEEMKKLPYVHILGSSDPDDHHGIVTFTIDGVHPHDIAAIFDSHNVNIRAGHHCAQPLMKFCQIPSTVRASIGLYNTEADIEKFMEALKQIRGEMGYHD